MCNRFRQVKTRENLSLIFHARVSGAPVDADTDLYPRSFAHVVREIDGRRQLDTMVWGIHRRMKGKSGKTIVKPVTNVRNLDSVFWKSTLRLPAQRCLVPFTAFAEPKAGKDGQGRPANWWFHLPAREVGAFAGIWRVCDGEACFAFLTCEPNPLVGPLHPKAMPVILHEEDFSLWLQGEVDDACRLAGPYPSQLMEVR